MATYPTQNGQRGEPYSHINNNTASFPEPQPYRAPQPLRVQAPLPSYPDPDPTANSYANDQPRVYPGRSYHAPSGGYKPPPPRGDYTPPSGGYQPPSSGYQPHPQEAYSTPQAPQSSAFEMNSPQASPTSTVYDDELTEEERVEYEKGVLTWSKCKDWRFWIRKEWIWYYVLFIVLVVLVALMAFFHHSIIDWLTPFVKRLQQLKVGWLIPVAIIFVLSFPPLFGNEIVMVLVGVVWGLGVGFAIVVVGTLLGEIANYFVFKYWCRRRADREAKKNLNYACLSQAIVEGGWFMAFVVRLSVIPTHISTVIFAVCGLGFWKFMIALIIGLPKQLITVYVGVILERNDTGQSSTNSHVISDCVFAATAVITIVSAIYIYRKMLAVRKKVLIGMRKDLTSRGIKTTDMPQGQLSGRDEA